MSTSSGASSSPPSSAAVAAIALVADDSAPVAPLPAKTTAAALHDAHDTHDDGDPDSAAPIALANGEHDHDHDAAATPAPALDMATASLALENLTNLPDDLHIVLRLVLDNDALLLHLAMQAYLHASHSLLLADWLAQSNPEHIHALLAHAAPVPLDALPAPVDTRTSPPPIASATAVCPPVSGADLNGYCADLASPFFAQRLEAALVHGIAYAAAGNSSNRDDPWVHWHSNFPGQISLWTSSATPPGAPPTSSTRLLHPPRAAGLAAVGASSLTIRYVDVDPVRADRVYKAGVHETRVGTAFVEDVSLDTDDEHEHGDDDAALGLDDMRADARYDPAAHGGTKLHPLAQFERVTRRDPVTGPLMRSFVGSIAYNVHVPLDHIVRVTLLRPVPRKASSDASAHHDPDAASTDDDSEDEEDDEDDSGQEILVLETARAPSFSVQALCPLSKHHYLAECDDWTGGMARAARRWMIVAERHELASLLALIPTRVPVHRPQDRFVAPIVRSWWEWPDLVRTVHAAVPEYARSCGRCVLPTPSASLSSNASSTSKASTMASPTLRASATRSPPPAIRHANGSRASASSAAESASDVSGALPLPGSVADDDDEQDGTKPLPVALHVLPSPALLAHVLHDTGVLHNLPPSLPIPTTPLHDGPTTALTTTLSPRASLLTDAVRLDMPSALATLKLDLGHAAAARARAQIDSALHARRQILNVLYLYGLLPPTDMPPEAFHPPTDLLHADSRTVPAKNHWLGTLKAVFTSCFADYLNFECDPATLGEVLNGIDPTLVLRPKPVPRVSAPVSPAPSPPPSRGGASSRGGNSGRGGGMARFASSLRSQLSNATHSAPPLPPRRPDPPQPTISAAPKQYFSLCRAHAVATDLVWHCSLCRRCVSIDHHHCPTCAQCVYVQGTSSLPQFRPSTAPMPPPAPAASDEWEGGSSGRASAVRWAPDAADGEESPTQRRNLRRLRTGVRASVHYLPCPTCANTSALPAVFRAPRAVTASADSDVADDALGTPNAWLDADAVQNLLAVAPPETVDDVVARAQAAVARLVVGVDGWIREEVADGESTDEDEDDEGFVDDEDGDLHGHPEDEFLDDRSDEITDAGELTDEEYVSDPAVRALRSKTFRLG